MRSQGFDVGEVAGACFCCSFDELVATADSLSGDQAPDVLLAEPVGSCTDLVATIVLPLQQLLGDRFEMAPFGVLLKPSHGRRILAKGDDQPRSGFSPQAEYIFRKQLEEADYLMIGRADQLTAEEIAALTQSLKTWSPMDIPVVAVSPKTGQGVDQVLGYIESPMVAGRRVLDIDYDTYADGEAELGWVNLTANLTSDVPVDLDDIRKRSGGGHRETDRRNSNRRFSRSNRSLEGVGLGRRYAGDRKRRQQRFASRGRTCVRTERRRRSYKSS